MTWKKLFFRTMLHDIKKRSWCMALVFIAQFFAISVRTLLTVQNYRMLYGNSTIADERNKLLQGVFEEGIFGFGNTLLLLILIASAVILAMSGYSYLNSRKKVDFIHSMPIKREGLFLSRYAAGVVLYMLPLMLNAGIGMILAVISGGFSGYLVKSVLWFLLYHLLYFMLFYSTAILAIVLIGNFIVSLLGIGILFSYQTVMWFVIRAFKRCFFHTYMAEMDKFWANDPVGLLIRQIQSFHYNNFEFDYAGKSIRIENAYYYATGGKMCLLALLAVVIIGGAALLLFRLRKSEAAGKTLVFPLSEPVIKVALLLPAGIMGGMFMRSISSGYRVAWYIFGAAFAFVLAAVVIEIIFRQDFKSLFKHKLSALAGAAVILVFTLSFQLDFFGFDSRIPKCSQIESVGISIPCVENADSYYTSDIPYEASYSMDALANYSYSDTRLRNAAISSSKGVLEACEITGEEEVEKVRALAAYYVKNKKEFAKGDIAGSFAAEEVLEDGTAEGLAEDASKQDDRQWMTCEVVYRLKNGKKVYRSYTLSYDDRFLEVIEPVFANESYKLAANPVLKDEKNYRYLVVRDNFMDKRLQIARSDKKALFECYQKDLMNLTFKEIWTQDRKGDFFMVDSFGTNSSSTCAVYEGSANTLAWLSEHDMNPDSRLDEVVVNEAVIEYCKDTDYKEIYLEEEEERRELLKYLVRQELRAPKDEARVDSGAMVMLQYYINSEDVKVLNDRGGEEYNGYYLKEIPDFVKDKL